VERFARAAVVAKAARLAPVQKSGGNNLPDPTLDDVAAQAAAHDARTQHEDDAQDE
jgi:hypothetical protein